MAPKVIVEWASEPNIKSNSNLLQIDSIKLFYNCKLHWFEKNILISANIIHPLNVRAYFIIVLLECRRKNDPSWFYQNKATSIVSRIEMAPFFITLSLPLSLSLSPSLSLTHPSSLSLTLPPPLSLSPFLPLPLSYTLSFVFPLARKSLNPILLLLWYLMFLLEIESMILKRYWTFLVLNCFYQITRLKRIVLAFSSDL